MIHPHYSLDTYCLAGNGYIEYAKIFIGAGRIIPAIGYMLFHICNVPYDFLTMLVTIIGDFFLALSCYRLEGILRINNKSDFLNRLICTLSIILIFYNFFSMEYFAFAESFAMCMGIYFMIESIGYFLYDTKRGYGLALIFSLLSIFCYQGGLSMYIPFLVLLVYLKYQTLETKALLIEFVKKGLIAIGIYGFSFVLSFLIMKTSVLFTGLESQKNGSIDLILNIQNLPHLIYESCRELFRYFRPLYFYFILCFIFILNGLKALYNKNVRVILVLAFIFLCCFLMPFAPNVFLPENVNYSAPRMAVAIPMTIGIGGIYYLLAYKKDVKILKILITMVLSFFFCVNYMNYHRTMNASNEKFARDKESIKEIYQRIEKYEKETGQLISKIYFAEDDSVSWFYTGISLRNGFTYRLYAVDWGMKCAVNSMLEDRTFEYLEMDDSTKKTIFGENVNYSEVQDEQFIFKYDTLYLLIY